MRLRPLQERREGEPGYSRVRLSALLVFFLLVGGAFYAVYVMHLLEEPAVSISAPAEGTALLVGSVEVSVRFTERARGATCRILIDDEDVTERFLIGENGASGTIRGLAQGYHRITVRVFSTLPGDPDTLAEEEAAVSIEVLPTSPFFDLAWSNLLESIV